MWGGREGTGREPRPTAACRAGSFPAFLKLPETEAVDVLELEGGRRGEGRVGDQGRRGGAALPHDFIFRTEG